MDKGRKMDKGEKDGQERDEFEIDANAQNIVSESISMEKQRESGKQVGSYEGEVIGRGNGKNQKVEEKKIQKEHLSRRVITEKSEKRGDSEIKKVMDQFNLPFKSVSPKGKMNTGMKTMAASFQKKNSLKSPSHIQIRPAPHLNNVSAKVKVKGESKSTKLAKNHPRSEKQDKIRELPDPKFPSKTSENPFPHPLPKSDPYQDHQPKLDNSDSNFLREVRTGKCSKKERVSNQKVERVSNQKVERVSNQKMEGLQLKNKMSPQHGQLRTKESFQSTSCSPGLEDIEILELIGQGTFGQVYRGRFRRSGEMVAVKRVLQDHKYKNREVEIVQQLVGDFVMKVLGTYVTYQNNSEYLNIIMDYYPTDLFQFIKSEGRKGLSELQIKLIMYQIFRGLLSIHSLGICHRDIKPHNLLVNRLKVVICDFGSAKILHPNEPNLSYICSRCYRAPELIFGATHYTTMIDIWSAGCVLLEMLNKTPLFIGESSIDHLIEVIKVMGTPTKSQVIDMNPDYDLNDYKLPKIKKKEWRNIFPKASPFLIDLIAQLMIYSPKQRLNAAEALCHEFFDELKEEARFRELQKDYDIGHFFLFEIDELTEHQHLLPKLIPTWF